MRTIWQLLEKAAAEHRDRTALATRRSYRVERWTYEDLKDFSERAASRLRKLGTEPGDRVLIWAPNTPEWVGLYFGCMRAGVVAVPLDVRSHPNFVAKVQVQAEAKILFTSSQMRTDACQIGVPVETVEEFAVRAREEPPLHAGFLPSACDVAEIMFTSGTTGDPKGVVLTHDNITSNVEAATQVVPVHREYRLLSLLPLSHMFEQTIGLHAPLTGGATVVYPASRHPAVVFKTFREHRITTLLLVPQALQLFWNAIEREVATQGKERVWRRALAIAPYLPLPARRLLFRSVHQRLGGCLKFVMCGGAYLEPELGRKWELLGVAVLQGYGTTEASPVVTTNSFRNRRLDSCGPALPGVSIRTTHDGEVLVKGPNVTGGYWRNPEATASALENGWYRTGDLGVVEPDGHLVLKGRKKDMIVLENGMNVYAQDVEAALNAHPAVKDSCVVGLSLPGGTIQVHAVLLLKESHHSLQTVVTEVNKGLAEHQRIRGATLWHSDDFPRTHTLKIIKREVLESLREGVARTAARPALARQAVAHDMPPLRRIAAEVAQVSPEAVRPDMRLEADLGMDSLRRVEFLAAIEVELGVYIDESQAGPETSISDMETLVARADSGAAKPDYPLWSLSGPARAVRAALQSVAALPLARVMMPMKVEGREHLQALSGPALFATNHVSHLDTVVVLAALPGRWRRRTAVAAAADYWFDGGRLKGRASALLFNAFPFSRADSIRPSLEHCGRLLDRGWSVLIYPEGTRSATGEMGAFKSGTGLMAVELGAPVVPVHIRGTYEVLSRDARLPRRGPVRVRFGTPLRFKTGTSYIDATRSVEEAVRQLGSPW